VRKRRNLRVVTGALASRVLFEGDRASGVEYRIGKRVIKEQAKREVLLCGGSLNSPQLLMLSGIGPAEHLREHGIALRADLPGRRRQPAGPPRHLHHAALHAEDHLRQDQRPRRSDCSTTCSSPAPAPATSPRPAASCARRWPRIRARTCSSISCRRSSTTTDATSCPAMATRCTPATCARAAAAACCWRARIPADKVRIEANYLSDAGGRDRAMMLECVKLSRQIFAQPAFAPYRGEELFPGDSVKGDAALMDFIERKAESIYHPVGTCRIGADDDASAVLDAQLRVRGVQGLRVVDASVMPKLIGGNTNAPTMMIAERAADLIRGVSARKAGK
jgi:choline dehydrogenase